MKSKDSLCLPKHGRYADTVFLCYLSISSCIAKYNVEGELVQTRKANIRMMSYMYLALYSRLTLPSHSPKTPLSPKSSSSTASMITAIDTTNSFHPSHNAAFKYTASIKEGGDDQSQQTVIVGKQARQHKSSLIRHISSSSIFRLMFLCL